MAAFQEVYEEYARPVYRFLLSLTGNEDLAEELLSETFYQAFKHIDRFEGRCNLYTWLCQIAKNAWLKERRRNKRYQEIEFDKLSIQAQGLSVEEQIINRETYSKVLKAVQALEEPYREVFVLHAIGEVKLKEIASVYSKSESWARVTYFRAKQQIVKELMK
ncbi:MAG: sigma-70 family RNA polymerase sigma factor [Clostridia bacterium]|nr:sigma-70 family RNA polymerase sigma factor [Clostridia bacterium]